MKHLLVLISIRKQQLHGVKIIFMCLVLLHFYKVWRKMLPEDVVSAGSVWLPSGSVRNNEFLNPLNIKTNMHYAGCLKCLEKLQRWIAHTKTRKKARINVCPQTFFEVQPPRSRDLSALDSYLWGHLKTAYVFISNLKWRDASPPHFDACQTIRNRPGTSKTLRQSMVRQVHAQWFRWRIFWACVVNSDFINNKNSTAVTLGTCVISTLCRR
jgi:hypothetical protein